MERLIHDDDPYLIGIEIEGKKELFNKELEPDSKDRDDGRVPQELDNTLESPEKEATQ